MYKLRHFDRCSVGDRWKRIEKYAISVDRALGKGQLGNGVWTEEKSYCLPLRITVEPINK